MNSAVQHQGATGVQSRIIRENANNLLWTAIRRNDSLRLKEAILNGADVEATDNRGMSPLSFAIKEGCEEAARTLVSAGAIIDRQTGPDRKTALHWAAINGRNKSLLFLLKVGANVSAETTKGWTPLHFSASEGRTRTSELLIKAGADVGARDWRQRTPLYCASEWGHLGIVKLLVEAGASVKAENSEGQTPQEIAAKLEHFSVESYLNSIVEK